MLKIIFKGKRYIFFGNSLENEDGAISTAKMYRNGEQSYAHYYPKNGGEIFRFQEKIGTRKDIKVLGKLLREPQPTGYAMLKIMGRWGGLL